MKIGREQLVQLLIVVSGEIKFLLGDAVLINDFEVWIVVANPLDLHRWVEINATLLFEEALDLRKAVQASRWARDDLAPCRASQRASRHADNQDHQRHGAQHGRGAALSAIA